MVFADRDYSPYTGASVWHNCPQIALLDPTVGWIFYEDFLALPCDVTLHDPTGWTMQTDIAPGGGPMTFPVSFLGGVASVTTGGAADNDETYFQAGHSKTVAPFWMVDASARALFFECRVMAAQHLSNSIFVGLAEEGACAANFLSNDDGVIADKDFIGFNILDATPAAWNYTHRLSGQVVVTQVGVAVNADDWHRFGFYFDGLHTVRLYINGALNATTYLTSAATFPAGQEMSPMIAVKTGAVAGNAKIVKVDYFKVVQIR